MSQSFNYRHLFYFWVVAKEGGIARAAERLDMAVQTISAQVRELEKSLGVSLLRNEGRTLVLTDAGVAALHEARGESLGESGGAVHIGEKCVAADEDAERRWAIGGAHGVRESFGRFVVHRWENGSQCRQRRRGNPRTPP